MTTIGGLREEAWGNYPEDNDLARQHFDAGFRAGVAAERRFTDPGKRLEALRLAANNDDLWEDVVRRAVLYYRFLTNTMRDSAAQPDTHARFVADGSEADPVDHAAAARTKARLNFTSSSGQVKVDTYAKIMAIVHEAGVFADPVLLASELGRVIIDAKAVGE